MSRVSSAKSCSRAIWFVDYLKSLMSTTLLSVCPRERISRRLFRIKVIEDGFGFEIRELTVPRRGTVSMY
jgi:hypothetical protein